MRALACLLGVAATALAQTATVSNLADSGAGSLRAAWTAANASTAASFIIDITPGATAGPVVLASQLPSLTKSNVTVRAVSGAGRLVVDARPGTPPGGRAMELVGNQIQFLAPCRILVQQGHAMVVRGVGTHIADLETFGGLAGNGLITAAGANGLTLVRFLADGFQQGLLLSSCTGARIADDGVHTAEVRNCASVGFNVANGGNHVLGSLVSTTNEIGLLVTNCPGLVIGRAQNPRGSITASRQQGIVLQQCTNVSIANLDADGNGTTNGFGVQIVGGDRITVQNVGAETNSQGGLSVSGGASNVRVGPAVATRGTAGTADIGLMVVRSTAVTVVDCTFGPDHSLGVLVGPDPSGVPANVTVCRCTITGNLGPGISVPRATDALVCSCTIVANIGSGLEASAASLATGPRNLRIANCSLSLNAGNGVSAQFVDGLSIGPGNRVDDNLFGGVHVYRTAAFGLRDCLSIDDNRTSGIWVVECVDADIARTPFRANRGPAIWGLFCTGLTVGPDVLVQDTVGTGLELDGSNGCRVVSSRITGSLAHGVHVHQTTGTPATTAHVLQSCVVADHPGLGVYHSSGAPMRCELCTIAGNLRGVTSNTNSMTVDSCIVYGNLLEDLQQSATNLTVQNSFFAVPAPTAGSSNTNVNPQFVSPAARDWRLLASSPAVGYANQSLTILPPARDAYGGPRTVAALDAGAYEVGAHTGPGTQLLLSSATMPHGGGGLAFHVRYPATAAGSATFLLCQLGPPSGSFPAFGATIPLGLTSALFLAAQDPLSVDTIGVVPADGIWNGALLWGGRIPATVTNQVVSLCAVAVDATPLVRAVSNVATFTIL